MAIISQSEDIQSVKIRPLLTGLASYIPGLYNYYALGTGGSNSASYCYGVWIKHLILLRQAGLQKIPNTIAELGPGDSLGIGLAALLSGANEYYALDVKKSCNTERNLGVLNELVELFRARARTPASEGFSDIKPYLDSNVFAGVILTEEQLMESLREERIDDIRRAIMGLQSDAIDQSGKIKIRYIVPWSDPDALDPESVNLIYSQAVLEHVDNIDDVYRAMSTWLKPGGYMSHEIDFRSHNLTKEWYGHWACNEITWRIARGKKPYLLNRQPCSAHVDLLSKYGFRIVSKFLHTDPTGITRKQLATKWQNMTDGDLCCAGAHIQAVFQGKNSRTKADSAHL